MFHRILVAIDESKNRDSVLAGAIALAEATHAQLRLLHVLSEFEADFPAYPLGQIDVGFVFDQTVYQELVQRYAQERQDFEQRHLALLQEAAQAAIAKNIPTDYHLAYGSPGKQICQAAVDWDADTIVLGRRGNSGVKELLLGSVSNDVLHRASCSVVVIQGTETVQSNPEPIADLVGAG